MLWEQPHIKDKTLIEFAKNIGGTWLQAVKIKTEPWTFCNKCYDNVNYKVNSCGGKLIEGYYFVKYGTIYQAIYHCIWEDNGGHFIDISPYKDKRNYIIFSHINNYHPKLLNYYNVKNFDLYKKLNNDELCKQYYYVYALIDPFSKKPFYIGKGKGDRAKQHLLKISRIQNANRYKENKINNIRKMGKEPIIEKIADNIIDENLAYDIEEHLIKKFGRKGYEDNGILANVCLDNRPPNHKGKTYEEIYGKERAREQIKLRTKLQVKKGGYGLKRVDMVLKNILKRLLNYLRNQI